MDDVKEKEIKEQARKLKDTIADSMISDEKLQVFEKILRDLFETAKIPFNPNTKKAFQKAILFLNSTFIKLNNPEMFNSHMSVLMMSMDRLVRKDEAGPKLIDEVKDDKKKL